MKTIFVKTYLFEIATNIIEVIGRLGTVEIAEYVNLSYVDKNDFTDNTGAIRVLGGCMVESIRCAALLKSGELLCEIVLTANPVHVFLIGRLHDTTPYDDRDGAEGPNGWSKSPLPYV